MNRFLLVTILAWMSVVLVDAAAGQTRVDQSVFGNGGGVIQGVQNSVVGTIGQPLIGLLTGPNRADVGFWYLLGRAASDVDEDGILKPREFSFDNPVPNPSNRSAQFRIAVPLRCQLSVRLFDPRGRAVRTLLDGIIDPGVYLTTLDASGLPCGIYFCRIEADGFTRTRRLVLLR